jgi:hypothetical protein
VRVQCWSAILGSAVPALYLHASTRHPRIIALHTTLPSDGAVVSLLRHMHEAPRNQKVRTPAYSAPRVRVWGHYVCRYRALYVFGCRLVHSVAMCLSAGLNNEALEHFPHCACPETPRDSCSKALSSLFFLSSFPTCPTHFPVYQPRRPCFTSRPYSFVCYPAATRSLSLDFHIQQPAGTSSWPQRGCPLSSPFRTAQNDRVCLDTLPRPPPRANPLHQSLRDHCHQDLASFKKLHQPIRVPRPAHSWILASPVYKTSSNKFPAVTKMVHLYYRRQPLATTSQDPPPEMARDQTHLLAP